MIPEHESPVRSILSQAKNTPFYPLKSFEDAKSYKDGVAVFEGDYGGQIYLTCPVSEIICDEPTLRQLLIDIDTHCFNYPDSAQIYYERIAQGSGIWGGSGGGIVTSDLWVHPELEKLGLEEIRAVIKGKQKRIRQESD